ncbi:MAG: BON domain-containing protein [Phycisphaerales bacterium]
MIRAELIKTDAQIRADVVKELQGDPAIEGAEVGVQVRSGIVTLSGTVSAYVKRLAARDAAHRVRGVLDVVDDTTVQVPAAWQRTDEDLAKAVRNALRWDVLVPDDRITTTVSRGVVTLHGSVERWAQRFEAEKVVQRLTGVRSILNRIAVIAPPVDAASIKREVESALERQSEREARRIGVCVQEGVVTLTGTLRSWGEKNAVERAASHTPGVRSVDDRTTVDPYK